MIAALAPLSLAATFALQETVCRAPFDREHRGSAATPSLAGLPGLFEVPVAASALDREVALSFHKGRTTATMPGATQQRNGLISIGFLPRLTLTARGSVMNDTVTGIPLRDLSVNAQYLVTADESWRPAVAIGAQDLSGANAILKARYVVASKSLAGRLRVTAGVGAGGRGPLNGVFGGVEIAPCSWLQFIAENDGRERNAGIRLAPFPAAAERAGVVPSADVLWRGDQGLMAAVAIRIRPRSAAVAPGANRPAGDGAPVSRAVTDVGVLRDVLTAHGFENVRVEAAGAVLLVDYENRRYNLQEWDALGLVMGEAARLSPADAREIRVTVRRLDLPVMQLTTGIAAFVAFVDGQVDAAAFGAQLQTTTGNWRESASGPASNSSRFRLDLTARPRLENLLLSEISVMESRLSIAPEASLQLGRGLALTARHAIELHRTRSFPDELRDPNADRILLHAALPVGVWPLSGAGAISQVSVGKFGRREFGIGGETNVPLGGGRFSAGVIAAVFGERLANLDRSVALGSLSVRHPPLGLKATVTAGRFFHGDVGAMAELERRFGVAELAFFVRSTNFASQAGARVALPMTTRRDPRPARVRVHLPDYFEHRQSVRILADIPFVRSDAGRLLSTDHEIPRVFRQRDRLHAGVLLSQLEALRSAASRAGR